MYKNNNYRECSRCGGKLHPVYFTEKERIIEHGTMGYTGRTRLSVSHLVCEDCMNNEIVDDSFDGAWY